MAVPLQIDDFEQQTLKLALFNDDLGWNDTLLAGGDLMFGKVEGEREDDKGNVIDGFSLADFINVRSGACWVEPVCGAHGDVVPLPIYLI